MKYKLYLLLLSVLLLQCQNPLQDVEIQISTDILHYTTLVQVEDGNGNPVSNLTVAITGQDADQIYNLAGTKTFLLQSGVLGLGVHPRSDPEEGMPVMFNIELSGTGFLTQNIPMTIHKGQLQQVIKTDVLNIREAPAGIAVATPTAPLQGGATAEEVTLETAPQNQATEVTKITMPAATQFQDAGGNTLAGGQLGAVIAHVDPSKESALRIFPGGGLISNNVQTPTGNTAGTFIPAGLVNIDMSVGGVAVKHFSQPITVGIQIDPSFTNMNTGGIVKAGDELSIYSYETGAANWKYEGNGTVEMIDGKPTVAFETTHLTWFMVGNFVSSCPSYQSLTLTGTWLTAGIKYPMVVEAMVAGKVVASVNADISVSENTVRMNNLPEQGVSIRVKNENGEILAMRAITGSCSSVNTITLSRPSVINKKVTMQLHVRCPNNVATIGVLPTFYLYYRLAKPTADVSGYKLLGVVEKGFISTTALTPGTVGYDFKAVWGDQVKYAHNKIVAADNTATVGDGEGELIGEIDPANNLQMLQEKCKEFGL
ncbi:hypothetical protein [Chitinophaga cymbidii]|uniref:Uncharacterized protein n=1 Tax=Chitinophaga cymbidii TaxID=1096750 RepID=A0A512RMJ6_9BACT|nr:hypothetical protein [Chitinophaga cymbidii]GEP96912.1 hypothetical protein CCY01nite_31720 [Chitinophaga cymbidii]